MAGFTEVGGDCTMPKRSMGLRYGLGCPENLGTAQSTHAITLTDRFIDVDELQLPETGMGLLRDWRVTLYHQSAKIQ